MKNTIKTIGAFIAIFFGFISIIREERRQYRRRKIQESQKFS